MLGGDLRNAGGLLPDALLLAVLALLGPLRAILKVVQPRFRDHCSDNHSPGLKLKAHLVHVEEEATLHGARLRPAGRLNLCDVR